MRRITETFVRKEKRVLQDERVFLTRSFDFKWSLNNREIGAHMAACARHVERNHLEFKSGHLQCNLRTYKQ